jgi:hypothetical protein
MSNKQFLIFIAAILAAFFGWLYYDSRVSTDSISHEAVQRDFLQAGENSSGGAQIRYLFNFPIPIYDHSHSTPQIEAISEKEGTRENYHIAGLTQSEFGLKTLYEFDYSKKMFQDSYLLWVENLRINFSYTAMTVYVSSQYPEGSCEYQATLDHENQHVQIHRKIYEKYQKVLQNALSLSVDIPLANHPITVQSLEDGKAKISELISKVTNPVFDQFQQEVSQEQAQLDTPDSYRELRNRCSNWQ